MNKNPVRKIIDVFGDIQTVANIVDLHRTAINKWLDVGRIPSQHQKKLLDAARAQHLELTAEDLIA